MNLKRVLIVHNYYQIPGGEDSVVENEKQMLEEHGHEVFFYSRNNIEIKDYSKWKYFSLLFKTVFNYKTYREVKKIIVDKNIDIVHVHNTLTLISPSIYYAAISCKIPVIQTIHNFRLLCPGATLFRDNHICEDCINHGLICAIRHNCYKNNKILTMACVINTKIHRHTGIFGKINYICLTPFNKSKLLNLKQINEKKVYIKPNFVTGAGDFVPAEQRENQYIFVGRIDKLKGIEILLKAWKLMGKNSPELIICGTGPMEDWCRQYIIKEQLTSVRMKGFVLNSEVKKIIAICKALLLPTKLYEGFPMSIVEAYSVGTPVITTNLGNSGYLVINGITGQKCDLNTPESIREAVLQIQTHKEIYATTYREYKNKYTSEINYNQLIKIYDKVSQTDSNKKK